MMWIDVLTSHVKSKKRLEGVPCKSTQAMMPKTYALHFIKESEKDSKNIQYICSIGIICLILASVLSNCFRVLFCRFQ